MGIQKHCTNLFRRYSSVDKTSLKLCRATSGVQHHSGTLSCDCGLVLIVEMVERTCTLVKTLQLYMRHEWILSQFYVEVF